MSRRPDLPTSKEATLDLVASIFVRAERRELPADVSINDPSNGDQSSDRTAA